MNIGEWECGDQRWENLEIRDGGMWRLEMGECGDQRWENVEIRDGECGDQRWENVEIRDGRRCARLEVK